MKRNELEGKESTIKILCKTSQGLWEATDDPQQLFLRFDDKVLYMSGPVLNCEKVTTQGRAVKKSDGVMSFFNER